VLGSQSISKGATSEHGRTSALLEALEESAPGLEPRRFVGVHASHARDGDVEAARENRFRIGDQQHELQAPVDWAERPYEEGDEAAFRLNCFFFADPLMHAKMDEEIRASLLESLAALFRDWIEQNPPVDAERQHKYAWYDHAAAARVVHLSHLLRESGRLGVLYPEEREMLAGSVIKHVDYLMAEENYQPAHNHGLFSDAGLHLAADALSFYPEAGEWSSLASERFRSTLARTIETSEGIHLEHTPFYQLVMRRALERFGSTGLLPPVELSDLLRRMDEATAWMTSPDGTLPMIGDGNEGAEPDPPAGELVGQCSGLRVFPRSGYAMVRDGDSYLFATAAFHSSAHKHSDDLSYCLYEDGHLLVGDAGNAGYDYEGAARQYCVSPAAHSGIGVDGYTWNDDPRGGAGSGLVASGSLDGTHAILAENPRIAPDHRVARRLFVYRPGRALAVIDDLVAEEHEVVERYLQLSPELSATVLSSGAVEIQREGQRVAWLAPLEEEGGAPDSVAALRGKTSPPMGGIYFPRIEQVEACTTLILSRYGGGMFGYLLSLTPGQDEPGPAWANGWLSGDEAELMITGMDESPLAVKLDGDSLRLSRT
jgi:Heparinase II/III-like protein/Heparinase II/III N-terminus